ncbi:MAG: glycine zipper 2TM domain-containing protein [Acidiferrobacterales bacterium]|nr:glycine zipper 2TM domain-containing protein [Acidiferrobacterales bacterium]
MIKIKYIAITVFSTVIGLINPTFVSASENIPSMEAEARVIRVIERYVTVIEQRPVEECRNVEVSAGGGSTSSDTPELIGAVLGGALGKELDKDGDSKEGAILGAILGASIASDIEKKNAQKSTRTTTERRCTTVNRQVEVQRVDGYDVTFEYQDKLFTSTMKRRPGATIPVKVYVLPDET